MLGENDLDGPRGVGELVHAVQLLYRANRLLLGRVFKVAAIFEGVCGVFQKLDKPELAVLVKQLDYVFFGGALGDVGDEELVGVGQVNIWKADAADLAVGPLELKLRGGLVSLRPAGRSSR